MIGAGGGGAGWFPPRHMSCDPQYVVVLFLKNCFKVFDDADSSGVKPDLSVAVVHGWASVRIPIAQVVDKFLTDVGCLLYMPHVPPPVMSQTSCVSTKVSPSCALASLYGTGVSGCPPREPSA